MCVCVFCLTCNGVLASVALLGHIGLEAVHAVNVVFVGSEATFRQRFTAGVAHEALGVPGVVLVVDPSRADWLKTTDRSQDTLSADRRRLGRDLNTRTEVKLLPSCSGSTSLKIWCRGRKCSRCHRPWSGSFWCGLAACIRSI